MKKTLFVTALFLVSVIGQGTDLTDLDCVQQTDGSWKCTEPVFIDSEFKLSSEISCISSKPNVVCPGGDCTSEMIDFGCSAEASLLNNVVAEACYTIVKGNDFDRGQQCEQITVSKASFILVIPAELVDFNTCTASTDDVNNTVFSCPAGSNAYRIGGFVFNQNPFPTFMLEARQIFFPQFQNLNIFL